MITFALLALCFAWLIVVIFEYRNWEEIIPPFVFVIFLVFILVIFSSSPSLQKQKTVIDEPITSFEAVSEYDAIKQEFKNTFRIATLQNNFNIDANERIEIHLTNELPKFVVTKSKWSPLSFWFGTRSTNEVVIYDIYVNADDL